MCPRTKTAALVLGFLLARTGAAADPAPPERARVQTQAPRLMCIPPLAVDARCITLPPGRFVDETTWLELDVSLREAQDARTRLTAENKSLRATAAGWQPGWRTLAASMLVGLAAGWYVHDKL